MEQQEQVLQEHQLDPTYNYFTPRVQESVDRFVLTDAWSSFAALEYDFESVTWAIRNGSHANAKMNDDYIESHVRPHLFKCLRNIQVYNES